MTRTVEVDGQPFALFVEARGGNFLVPPLILDSDGNVAEGAVVVAAFLETGVLVNHPVARISTTAQLNTINQLLAALSEQLDVPIGPLETAADEGRKAQSDNQN